MIRRRRKRAGEEDLYRTCRVTGNCPPDIKNKFEQNTLADKILKYGSTAVYFGGLGIGTGSSGTRGPGTIGRGGGISLGSGVSTRAPDLPINTLGPESLIPIDAIDPLGPSVVPGAPDIIRPPRFPSVVEDLPPYIRAEVDIGPEVTIGPSGDGGPEEPTVISIEPEVTVTSQYHNPTFEITHLADTAFLETSVSDSVVVTHSAGEVIVGGDTDFIPLRGLPRPQEVEGIQETSFMTSTPTTGEVQAGRGLNLFSRRFQQVRVDEQAFLDRPRSLVTFDNPAFEEEDITIIFEQDVDDVTAAPQADFTDIRELSRPVFTRREEGLTFSRLGRRGTITTRSGLQIGANVHFYYDISGIEPVDTIELRTLGEQSLTSEIVSRDTNFDNISLETISESDLVDDFNSSVGENLQLIITGSGTNSEIVPISFNTDLVVRRPPHFYPSTEGGVHVFYPETTRGKGSVQPDDRPPIVIHVSAESVDYDLHPSLLKRKRKRAFL